MRKLPQIVLAALLLMIVGSVALAAETARTESLERKVEELKRMLADLKAQGTTSPATLEEVERQIEVLVQEIEDMKLGEAAPPASAEVPGLGPAASRVYAIDRGVSIGGYGEMLYESFDSSRQDGSPSGESARLDFLRAVAYLGYKFNDRILFNSEIEVEHATTGEGDEERGEVSLEFAYLDFLFRDAVNVRAGMLLVPVGFLNELHEPPIFLGTRRPFVEQVLIPTTWRENGAGIYGEAGPIDYRVYLVTSLAAVEGTSSGAEGFSASGIRDGRSGGSNSAAEDFAWTGRLDWKPIEGLVVGASFFTGDTGQGQLAPSGEKIEGRTTLLDAHADYRFRGLEARALFVRTSIDDAALINAAQGLTGADSVGERQQGWYGQVGYDLFSGRGTTGQALIPYLRYEQYNTQDRVPSGFAADPGHDATVATAGIAWKPIPNVVVKTDFNRMENEARTGVDQFNVALGFLF